jgi:hypothetical protein
MSVISFRKASDREGQHDLVSRGHGTGVLAGDRNGRADRSDRLRDRPHTKERRDPPQLSGDRAVPEASSRRWASSSGSISSRWTARSCRSTGRSATGSQCTRRMAGPHVSPSARPATSDSAGHADLHERGRSRRWTTSSPGPSRCRSAPSPRSLYGAVVLQHLGHELRRDLEAGGAGAQSRGAEAGSG